MSRAKIKTDHGDVEVVLDHQLITLYQGPDNYDIECLVIPVDQWFEINAAVQQLVAEHKLKNDRSKHDGKKPGPR